MEPTIPRKRTSSVERAELIQKPTNRRRKDSGYTKSNYPPKSTTGDNGSCSFCITLSCKLQWFQRADVSGHDEKYCYGEISALKKETNNWKCKEIVRAVKGVVGHVKPIEAVS